MNNGWIQRLGQQMTPVTLGLGLWITLAGCHVPSPKPDALLRFGFGSPGQAFRSFVTAIQGKMLDPLYDSFSSRFKADNHLSRNGSHEAFDDLTAQEPLLRYALFQATKDPEKLDYWLSEDGSSARVETVYRGRTIRVFLVREAYWELYTSDPEDPAADPRRESDRNVADLFSNKSPGGMVFDNEAGPLWAYGPPPRAGIASLAHYRAGYEWKVDDFQFIDIP